MYLTSCSDNDSPQKADTTPLTLSVGLAGQPARAIIEETTLPEGSEIGLFLTDDGGSTYDGTTYANVKYTATGTGDTQTWDADADIMLSATPATLHAYYPYNSSVTNIQDVPVEAASLTDYMYATTVSGLSVSSNEAQVTLNHALTAIKLTLTRGTYSGTGKVTNLSVTSDALATAASLDATTGELSAITGAGAALAHDTDLTLTKSPQSTVVTAVPTTATATVNITATVDGLPFAVTTSATAFRQGNVYEYSLTVNNESMTVADVNVTPWNTVTKEDMTMKLYQTYDLATAANGVYAVTKDGLGVKTELADGTCIAVALITDNQRIWIEKYETDNTTSIKAAYEADGATNTDYKLFYWGMYGSDNASITNYSKTGGGGTSYYGYLPKADGTYTSTPNLSSDYTTWTSGALSDFSGKENTAALQAAPDTDSYTSYANMATWVTKFNETASENQGYSDWYIPAGGQLALIYLNMTSINATLTKIGGTNLASSYYWSSSEYNSNYGWNVDFGYGFVDDNYKGGGDRVRVVRDIAPTITFTIADVQYTAIQGWTWQQWINSKFNVDGYYIGNDGLSIFQAGISNYIPNVTANDVIIQNTVYALQGSGTGASGEGD